MTKEGDLIKLEILSEGLSELIFFFEDQIKNHRVIDRYRIRSKSPFYQLTVVLIHDVNRLKGTLPIFPNQLEELRRRVYNLFRLIEETELREKYNNGILEKLEKSVRFELV